MSEDISWRPPLLQAKTKEGFTVWLNPWHIVSVRRIEGLAQIRSTGGDYHELLIESLGTRWFDFVGGLETDE